MCRERLYRQDWTPEPEFFFGHSIFSCRSVPCRLRILLLWLPFSSSPWICWLSPDWRGSVRVQSPCEEAFQCQAGMEAVGWWSGCDCYAGTLPGVRCRTNRLVTHSQRARGTGLTPGWRALFVHQFENARLWKTPTLFLAGSKVLWWNELQTGVRSPRLCTSESCGASRLDAGRAWLLLLPLSSCASEWSVFISILNLPLSSLHCAQRRGEVPQRNLH